MQALFDLDPLGFLKFVLLLEGVVGDDLVVDTVVELAIVIELVLSVDLSALLAEAEHLLLDLHQLHELASVLSLALRALLTHGRVERCQNDRLGLLVLQRAVLRL